MGRVAAFAACSSTCLSSSRSSFLPSRGRIHTPTGSRTVPLGLQLGVLPVPLPTLPVTMRCLDARGVPKLVSKFTAPLGTLINMDGTAIYFPMVVVFLAVTQGMTLNAGDYTIIVLLSVLSSIATTPIPSSSPVLTIMIANSVGIPITGMYAVVVAIDWFIDRFRTATNVSGDMFAGKIMQKVTGISDEDTKDFNYDHNAGVTGEVQESVRRRSEEEKRELKEV